MRKYLRVAAFVILWAAGEAQAEEAWQRLATKITEPRVPVAVLPFENRTQDRSYDWLAAGLRYELLDGLGYVWNLDPYVEEKDAERRQAWRLSGWLGHVQGKVIWHVMLNDPNGRKVVEQTVGGAASEIQSEARAFVTTLPHQMGVQLTSEELQRVQGRGLFTQAEWPSYVGLRGGFLTLNEKSWPEKETALAVDSFRTKAQAPESHALLGVVLARSGIRESGAWDEIELARKGNESLPDVHLGRAFLAGDAKTREQEAGAALALAPSRPDLQTEFLVAATHNHRQSVQLSTAIRQVLSGANSRAQRERLLSGGKFEYLDESLADLLAKIAVEDESILIRLYAVRRLKSVSQDNGRRYTAIERAWADSFARFAASERERLVGAYPEDLSPKARLDFLVSALRDPDADVRVMALHELGALSGYPVKEVVRCFKDADPRVRRAAVRVLGENHAPEAEKAIAGLIDDPDDEVALAAAMALVSAESDVGADAVFRSILDKGLDLKMKWPFGQLLPIMKDKWSQASLERSANRKSGLTSLSACFILAERKQLDAVLASCDSIIMQLVLNGSPKERVAASVAYLSVNSRGIEELDGRMPIRLGGEEISALARDENGSWITWQLLTTIIGAGGQVAEPESRDHLVSSILMPRSEPLYQKLVLEVLALPQDLSDSTKERARAWVEPLLRSPDSEIRDVAEVAYGALVREEEWGRVMDSASPEIRRAVAVKVRGTSKNAREVAERLMADSDPLVQVEGARVLDSLGDVRGIAKLRQIPSDGDAEAGKRAVSYLAGHCEPETVAYLSEVLKRYEQEARTALYACGKRAALVFLRRIEAGYRDSIDIDFVKRFGTRETSGLLLEALNESGDEGVNDQLADAIIQTADESAVPTLMKLASGKGIVRRIAVIKVLGHFRGENVSTFLRTLLHDENPKIRAAGARALARQGSVNSVAMAEDIAASVGSDVATLLVVLLHVKEHAVAEVLIQRIVRASENRAPNPRLPWVAAAKWGDPHALSAIGGAIIAGETWDEQQILGESTRPEVIAWLLKESKSKNAEERAFAIEALGFNRTAESRQRVVEALSDADVQVRIAAVYSLMRFDDNESTGALIGALDDRDRDVQQAAIMVLGERRGDNVILALRNKERRSGPGVRFLCHVALTKLGERSYLGEIGNRLEFLDHVTRRYAAEIYAREGGEPAAFHFRSTDKDSIYLLSLNGTAPSIDYLYSHLGAGFGAVRTRMLFPQHWSKAEQSSKSARERGMVAYLRALQAREQQDVSEQMAQLEEALKELDDKYDTGLVLLALVMKGTAELRDGDVNKASETVNHAENVLQWMSQSDTEDEGGDYFIREELSLLKGMVLAAVGGESGQQAAEILGRAADQVDSRTHEWVKERATRLRARILTELGLVQEKMAGDSLRKADELGSQYMPDDSLGMASDERRYASLARLSIAEGDYEQAQKWVEKLRLRSNQYRQRQMKIVFADKGRQEWMDRYESLTSDIRALEQDPVLQVRGREARSGSEEVGRNARGGTQGKAEAIQDSLSQKRRELRKYLTQLKRAHPELAVMLAAEPVELAQVQALLPQDSGIVQYLILPEKLVIFTITKTGLDVTETPVGQKELEGAVRSYRHEIRRVKLERRVGAAPDAQAKRLYDFLIEPLEKAKRLEGLRTLGIVPTGVLHYIPFSALLHDTPKGSEYLVERYALYEVSSTSLLKVALDQEHEGTRRKSLLVAIGDPDGSLPAARGEVQDIANLFQAKQVYLGAVAQKKVLYQGFRGPYVLHLATHGFLDQRDGAHSRLLMSDGELSVEEIWGLPLGNVTLTTLSGCDTSVGEILSGDDIISMETAFIYAGSPSVIASYWPVEDSSTAKLMELFYRELLAGGTKAEALSRAQRLLLKSEKYGKHPFYWAGFSLRGDWR